MAFIVGLSICTAYVAAYHNNLWVAIGGMAVAFLALAFLG